MVKYVLLIALTLFSVQLAYSDDASDTDQAPARRNAYQKLGITNGQAVTAPSDAASEATPPEREPAQEAPQKDDGGNTTQPRDTSDQPLKSQ